MTSMFCGGGEWVRVVYGEHGRAGGYFGTCKWLFPVGPTEQVWKSRDTQAGNRLGHKYVSAGSVEAAARRAV